MKVDSSLLVNMKRVGIGETEINNKEVYMILLSPRNKTQQTIFRVQGEGAIMHCW